MNILEITNSKLNEHYIKAENEFNLKVLLYPMPQFSTTCAAVATSFGSTTTYFKNKNDLNFTNIPDGTAHYLEHKLFKDQGENNTFNLFAGTGAKANAQTSKNSTSYFFYCTQNFEKSLEILLDFVQNPDFNEQSIQKERGIVEQEIQMLEDTPTERMFNNCMKALYHNHPARKKIGGTIESISKIDSKLLQKCYDAFYSLNNMAILISGKFNLDHTLKTIEQNLKTPNNQLEIELKKIEEPYEVVTKFVKCDMAIMIPHFCVGYKIKPFNKKFILKQKLIFEIICELLTGEGTNLQNVLYKKNLVSNGILSYSIETGKGYFAVLFAGLSTNYEEVFKLLNSEIAFIQKNGFNANLFNLIKKSAFGEQIANFNSVKSLSDLMLDCFDLTNYELFTGIDTISNLTLNEVNEQVKLLDVNNCSLSVCLPKNPKN